MQLKEGILEETFTVEKIEPFMLYGVGDEHLKLIEKHFNVNLIARGNQIKIVGDEKDVKMVEDVFSELTFIANRNKSLNPKDVETVIHVFKANALELQLKDTAESPHRTQDLEEVILFTRKGFIKARTNGQKEILDAVKKNDIVVIVGPAGTGKTYLSVALVATFA